MIGLSFALVGATCIIISFLVLHPNLLPVKLVSLATLKKVCNYQVNATIVRNEQDITDDVITYCPVYSFNFKGKNMK